MLSRENHFKVLFNFANETVTGYPYNFNGFPVGPLVQGRDSHFYGATQTGFNGSGAIFKLSPSGSLENLHIFCSPGSSGCSGVTWTTGALFRSVDGFFYATGRDANGNDILYRLAPDGNIQIVFTYPGSYLLVSVMQASDGNFYGLANGGAHQIGKVFRLTPSGQLTTIHDFGDHAGDGAYPAGTLLQAKDGDLYGATIRRGAHQAGTIFRISLSGAYAKIFDFEENVSGRGPLAGPIQASDGNLWGLTTNSNSTVSEVGPGNVYAITPSGTLLAYVPLGCPIGRIPSGAFTQGINGKLYTGIAGCNNGGAIIEVDAALPPPTPSIAGFTPASGHAGTTIVISGAYFVSASAVAFDDTPATFVVNAAGVITAICP